MIELKNISKTFYSKKQSHTALEDVSITINDGDIFGIIGVSGAGKSTLIRCINLISKPSSGQVIIDGTDISDFKHGELINLRRKIGMIFQNFNLLMQKTVLENVAFPLKLAGVKKEEALLKASKLLETVGLSDKENNYPSQLSGGQKQRVAIARALANEPKILLCDEATSALDSLTTHSILELLQKLNRELNLTIVIITHEIGVVKQICNNVAVIDESKVVEIGQTDYVLQNPTAEITKELIKYGGIK